MDYSIRNNLVECLRWVLYSLKAFFTHTLNFLDVLDR